MEVFLADLIQQQRQSGIDAYALVHGEPLPEDPHWLQRVPVHFSLAYAPIALGFRGAFVEAIRKVQPDILHFHMPNNSAFWALTIPIAKNIPWVVHWHSDVVVSRISSVVSIGYQIYRPFEQEILERAQTIITTSPPYMEASEPLQYWKDKCITIPLGLKTSEIPASPREDFQEENLWCQGAFRILSIGRLTYYKGFETLIKAVSHLPNVELLIAGEGELRDELQALVQSVTPVQHQARVRLLGEVSEPRKQSLLQQCDIFCLASRERTEAFGVVLLEAMYYGKPCIVSDLPGSGMPWLVSNAKAGLLASPENVGDWITKIVHMRDNPQLRSQCGEMGRNVLLADFSISKCTESIAREYFRLSPATPPQAGKDLLIVIPARNEAATIGTLIQKLHAAGWHDLVVIDDKSTDQTGNIARAAGAIVISPTLPLGAWGGMQTGIRYAICHGYQSVITMDADGQHEVDQIDVLLKARSYADLVIGAFPDRASKSRRIAWYWFRRLAGFDLRDLTSGFRLYNLNAMQLLSSHEATLLDYQDLGALILAIKAKLKIVEVSVLMNIRTNGKSRIFNSWLSVARYMISTTLICISRRKIYYRSKK